MLLHYHHTMEPQSILIHTMDMTPTTMIIIITTIIDQITGTMTIITSMLMMSTSRHMDLNTADMESLGILLTT